MAAVQDDLEEFLMKYPKIDDIDETRLKPLREASPEPEVQYETVDLEGIVPPEVEPVVQETAKAMTFKYTWEEENYKKWTFVFRNKSTYLVTITMNFTGSNSLNYDTEHELNGDVVVATCRPLKETLILNITADNARGWSLQSNVNLKFSEASPEDDDQIENIAAETVNRRLERYRKLGQPYGPSILHWLHEKREHFIDLDFPPLRSSLFESMKGHQSDNTCWRRVRDFCESPVVVQNIGPNDIDQGELGDCWILSSMTALAEHPTRFEKLLVTKHINECGVFQVRLCVAGNWQTITLDEYLPCHPQGGPKYTSCTSAELYISLLEKAFAKIYGNYERCVEGDAANGMTTLTGCPVKTLRFKHNSREEVWQQLMDSASKDDDLLTISTSLPKSKLRGSGIITNHSYTVLDAKGNDDNGIKLLCIRNPWASGEWTGAWSDNSDLWTPEMIEFFGATLDDDDGTFWMAFDDVLRYFQRLSICFCEPGTKVTRIPFPVGVPNDELMFVSFRCAVPEDGIIQWCGIHQQDMRISTAPEYTDLTVLVLRADEDGNMQAHKSLVSYKNFCFEELNLGPGEYEFVVFSSGRHLGQVPVREVTLTLHHTWYLENSSMEQMTDIKKLEDTLIQFAKLGDCSEFLDGRLKSYYCHDNLHVWACENCCEEYEFELNATLGLHNMVTALFCEDGANDFKVPIGPWESKLVTSAVVYDFKKDSRLTRNMSMTGNPV